MNVSNIKLRLLKPAPPRLSGLLDELRAIEQRGVFSNYGPINTELEHALVQRVFGGGHCLAVSNATSGLMLALKHAAFRRPGRRYAVMPSFTFAATAHAALWAGLTPVLCDIDPATWLACPEAEGAAVERYGELIAAVVPCATFGRQVDPSRYQAYAARYGCAIVLDAAAALGTRSCGRQLTAGGEGASVFSMHATKAFATFEGGVVHSSDPEFVAELRSMGNFGFTAGRAAVMPGMNTKLSEVAALVGLARIDGFAEIVARRAGVAATYRELLPGFDFQPETNEAQAHMFMPALLPRRLAPCRAEIRARMSAQGIETGIYYSPHLAEQPYFAAECRCERLPVTQDVAARVLSLPMHDNMDTREVRRVAAALRRACGEQ